VNAILTLLCPICVVCIAVAIVHRYGHRFKKSDVSLAISSLVAVGLAMSSYYGWQWNQNYWLGDVRTGDVFSMDMSTRSMQDIMQRTPYSMSQVELTVAGLAVPQCTQNLYPGKDVDFDLASGSYSFTLVGRATRPDYRYLLRSTGKPGEHAAQALGPGCVSLFFITPSGLQLLKQYLKHLRDIMGGTSGESPVLGELLSVQPLRGHP
jgi:hypothetical protein